MNFAGTKNTAFDDMLFAYGETAEKIMLKT